jgi:hypothetical protein
MPPKSHGGLAYFARLSERKIAGQRANWIGGTVFLRSSMLEKDGLINPHNRSKFASTNNPFQSIFVHLGPE